MMVILKRYWTGKGFANIMFLTGKTVSFAQITQF